MKSQKDFVEASTFALVEQMLALHKLLPEARTPYEETALPAWMEARTERSYRSCELYGLTEEEDQDR